MTIWDFMNNNGTGLFILSVLVILLIRSIYKQKQRSLRVRERGWPPAHLDSDRNFKSEDKP